MSGTSLKSLFENLGRPNNLKDDCLISGITSDSKRVKPGWIFVAVKGYQQDGHNFLNNALKNGASAVVVEKSTEDLPVPFLITDNSRKTLALLAKRFYGDPGRKLNLIGVTGTNGKTTTTYFLESIYRQAGHKVGVVGTLNYRWPGFKDNALQTTPDSVVLYGYFSRMINDGVSTAIMEVSSHALAQYRVEGLMFNSAIFTNISHEHLDYHKSLDEYVKTKARLFSQISKNGRAVVNIDDNASEIIIKNSSAKVVTYGKISDPDYRISDITLLNLGSRFVLKTPDLDLQLHTNLPGLFNVYNASAAACAALEQGVSPELVIKGIESLKRVPGRMEGLVSEKGQFRVIVDYAHTPDALEKILRCSKEFTEGRLITVFGCGGDRDRTKRPVMGRVASEVSDQVIITSDNPRTEDPSKIISEIFKGVKKNFSEVNVIEDREQAIKQAISIARKGDTVVIAGKGHEDYQIIGTKKIHFSDVETAEKYLKDFRELYGSDS